MVYPDKRILFNREKEWSTDICYSMNEPWKIMLNEKKIQAQIAWFHSYELYRKGKSTWAESKVK